MKLVTLVFGQMMDARLQGQLKTPLCIVEICILEGPKLEVSSELVNMFKCIAMLSRQ